MTEKNGANAQETPVPGLWMTKQRLEYHIERNRFLLARGLNLLDLFDAAADAQEAELEKEDAAARAQGQPPVLASTEEERAWDEYHDRSLTGIAQHHRELLEAFGMDPRRSVLFPDYPVLLARACDPQCPVFYRPATREFLMQETWGPAALHIMHCPWSGKALPPSLAEVWDKTVSTEMGTEDWSPKEAQDQLPDECFTEDWWIARGL